MANSSDAEAAHRRLKILESHLSSSPPQKAHLVVVLPDGGKLILDTTEDAHRLLLDTTIIAQFVVEEQKVTFDAAATGTKYRGATTHLPGYNVISIIPTGGASAGGLELSDVWTWIYGLITIYHTQESIPLNLSNQLPHRSEISTYILRSGLGRCYTTAVTGQSHDGEGIIFLSRAAFWQGAGVQGYHSKGWLPNPQPHLFPLQKEYTRHEKVITSHPLRPQKPDQGEVLYRRWCGGVDRMLEISYFDLEGTGQGDQPSKHMAAFHKWHNDERVSSAWGENGSLETHVDYVKGLLLDPHVWPCMLSWDGELMGYCEIVWVKEDHVAHHYPEGVSLGDWDRGVHVLVGESKFAGRGISKFRQPFGTIY